ncbi:MAG: hypothetical protein U5K36_06450 [Roseovarius sp.]|nr:hypothetical protein [Roseovarius sp.]
MTQAPNGRSARRFASRIQMSSFSKYRGLFAGGGDFDVPAMLTLGAAFTPNAAPDWTITGEYQRIFYGDINAIANTSAPPGGPLGASNGVGFGWQDVDVWRLAAIWRKSDRLTLRGGVAAFHRLHLKPRRRGHRHALPRHAAMAPLDRGELCHQRPLVGHLLLYPRILQQLLGRQPGAHHRTSAGAHKDAPERDRHRPQLPLVATHPLAQITGALYQAGP